MLAPRDPLAVLNPSNRPIVNVVSPAMMAAIDRGEPFVVIEEADRIGILVRLRYGNGTFLYGSRAFDADLGAQMRLSDSIAGDYRALQARSRSLQLRFNAALLGLSLLIVGLAVWIALRIADRLVKTLGKRAEEFPKAAHYGFFAHAGEVHVLTPPGK